MTWKFPSFIPNRIPPNKICLKRNIQLTNRERLVKSSVYYILLRRFNFLGGDYAQFGTIDVYKVNLWTRRHQTVASLYCERSWMRGMSSALWSRQTNHSNRIILFICRLSNFMERWLKLHGTVTQTSWNGDWNFMERWRKDRRTLV